MAAPPAGVGEGTVRRLGALVGACSLAGLLLAPTAAWAAPPRSFFGMQAWSTPSKREFHRMSELGVGTYRANLLWSSVEPQRGARHWSGFDELVRRAAAAGQTVLPVFLSSPAFASARLRRPPRTADARRAYAAFVRDAVERYGPDGDFWLDNGQLPYRPIGAWQVWNEPNFSPYWGPPNPREYVALMRLTRTVVRQQDPDARIVMAGIPETSYRGRPTRRRFLRGVYATRGAKQFFDVLALHAYERSAHRVVAIVREMRVLMDRAGDRRTPIWVTETGWATGGRRAFLTTTESGQAARLRSAYRALVQRRRRWRIGMVAWFSWRDRRRETNGGNWWGLNTGLLRKDGSAKPALSAYGSVAGG